MADIAMSQSNHLGRPFRIADIIFDELKVDPNYNYVSTIDMSI